MSDYTPIDPKQDSLGSKWLHVPSGLTVELTRERNYPGLRWGELQPDGSYAGLHAPMYEWINERLGVKCHRVLDAGCGSGYGSSVLKTHIVTGIDVSEEAIAFAHATHTHLSPSSFLHRDMLDVEGLGKFYAIAAVESIEHVEDDVALVQAWRSIVDVGGRLFVTTPEALTGAIVAPMSEYHVREYTEIELAQLLETHGWEITAWREFWPGTMAVEAVAV